ncbi:BOS complex subunit NOMO1-like [Physella acuta]|uniref:BOS complex subunit NOMO1-like n=1 Tax=Physella acuta TaxID=109671 RepID=UPI0027DB31CA|nr:BOS complex subunit NOMO1-like [Physella acuta]
MFAEKMKINLICFFLLNFITPYSLGDGVFGCGGFVKSDVDINYSLVEVKLYTPHGSIKYQTDCAPNTGYYLIPLYDKGDYILKAEPPKGWGFEPASVELKVDGENDPCSKGEDINFKFTGFSIMGIVASLGQTSGPAGVKLDLISSLKPDVLQSTLTDGKGSFVFSNVMPGDYKILASHSSWQFSKGEVTVHVKNDNANVGTGLTIGGYDVRGEVTGDGQPMKSVNFVLFSQNNQPTNVVQCEKGSPKGFLTKESKLTPLCYVTSKDDGSFVFPVVPSGSYFIIPFYKGEHITFDVEPEKLEFEVSHGSVILKEKFEIAGFSVSGKVLDKENGVGIPKATIIINGKDQTTSGSDGSFSLENMKTGTYRLTARVDNVAFEEMSVEITPKTPQLPNLIASGFNMCGKVSIDRVPESLGKLSSQRKVIYYPEGKGSDAKSVTTDSTGSFCELVKSEKYIVKVYMSDVEIKAGLTLTPSERVVVVLNKPVLDVNFSQFRAKISGSVKCMEKCQNTEITLDVVGRTDTQMRTTAKLSGNEASFTFENVMPGKYKASILLDNWCWKEKSIELDVLDNDLTGLEFIHTGYILKCSVSHPITINFADNKKEKSVGSFLLDKGLNRFCLAHPGIYQLTPDSCHRFDQENYSYDTSNPLILTLTAIQHLALGTVTTDIPVDDIVITIKSSVDDIPTVLGPLKPNTTATSAAKASAASADKENKKQPTTTVYNFSHWARSGETLTVSAKSSDVLFYPSSVDAFISGDGCPGKIVDLIGRKGVFIEGKITPSLSGVTVTVSDESGTMTPIVLITDSQGKYRVGPLHADKKYLVAAEKEGYVMSKEKEDSLLFRAFKLGEIAVQMLDEKGQPLPSVLLSLSGDHQYRSNNVTGTDGHMIFTGLSPGQYFLRPMMKEYKFEPASQIIIVQEGTTEKISIKGARVAFSCFGKVTSLNGEPEPGIIIEALGKGDCSVYQEESKTETDGSYRIRGLQPNCLYDIHLKSGEVNTHIERTAPTARQVQVSTADLQDINIIAFRRMNQMDISGNIRTNLKFLHTLRVSLVSEAQPDTPIHIVALSKSSFFFLPTLVMDNKNYLLTLESSLSRSEYDYKLPSVEFAANRSHRHFTFVFNPKPKSVDQDLNQGSFLVLPIIAILVALIYNHKTVVPYLLNVYQHVQAVAMKAPTGLSSPTSSSTSSSSSNSPSPDAPLPSDFFGESSPVKRKTKPRKAQ